MRRLDKSAAMRRLDKSALLKRLRVGSISGAVVLCALLGLADPADAGVIVAVERSGETCIVNAGMSEAPQGDPDVAEQRPIAGASHDAAPSGTGASGGYSIGVSIVAVLDQPCGIRLSQAFSASLEERRLSLPDSPVSARLRPPRG